VSEGERKQDKDRVRRERESKIGRAKRQGETCRDRVIEIEANLERGKRYRARYLVRWLDR
jgi:hypothetical protein